jgi:membrane protein DedA with SNARE-associated domain
MGEATRGSNFDCGGAHCWLHASTEHRIGRLGSFAGAVIGASVGFRIGREVGFRLIVRYGGHARLNERRIKLGRYLFWHHGGKVVFSGRFVPILRALAALLAGVSRMKCSRFTIFSMGGPAGWPMIYGFAAYGMGDEIKLLSGPVGVAFAVIVLIMVGIGAALVRRHEERLADEAERKFPGPISRRRSRG